MLEMRRKTFHRVKNLVKHDASPESLRKYHSEGWHFFIRTVGMRRYITIRRKGEENSLSPYSDDVWNVIEGIDNRGSQRDTVRGLSDKELPKSYMHTPVIEKTENPLLKTIEEINRYIRRVRFLNCLHIGVDRLCSYYRLEELPEHAVQLDKKNLELLLSKAKRDDGEKEAWALKALPYVCDDCTAYVDEKMLGLIKSRI